MLPFPLLKLAMEVGTPLQALSLLSTSKVLELILMKASKFRITFLEIQIWQFYFYWPRVLKLAVLKKTPLSHWWRRKRFLWFASSNIQIPRPFSKLKTSCASRKIILAILSKPKMWNLTTSSVGTFLFNLEKVTIPLSKLSQKALQIERLSSLNLVLANSARTGMIAPWT